MRFNAWSGSVSINLLAVSTAVCAVLIASFNLPPFLSEWTRSMRTFRTVVLFLLLIDLSVCVSINVFYFIYLKCF